MATHELKTWPEPFQAIWSGLKTAEFRKDDREPPFRVGDYMHLREWSHDLRCYTGRMVAAMITDIRRAGKFGIPEGFAMLSFGPITRYPRYPDGDDAL